MRTNTFLGILSTLFLAPLTRTKPSWTWSEKYMTRVNIGIRVSIKNNPVLMRVSTFLVTELVTFGIVYIISWLRRRVLITLETA